MVPRGVKLWHDENKWLIVISGPTQLRTLPKFLSTATVDDYYYILRNVFSSKIIIKVFFFFCFFVFFFPFYSRDIETPNFLFVLLPIYFFL